MSDILARILARKREEIATAAAHEPLDLLERRAMAADAPRGFRRALAARIASGRAAVIAEVKKASPSKGVIRADFHPAEIAASYAAGGATCLSVLTDRDFFQGADEYLCAARAACALPVLRKDFTIDARQVLAARALGADCILLIVAALGDRRARRAGARRTPARHGRTGRSPRRSRAGSGAARAGADLIGVNNRDLRSFEVSLDTTLRLRERVPADRLLVAESGIHAAADVARLRAAGVHAFLVGEAFMRVADPGAELARLFT